MSGCWCGVLMRALLGAAAPQAPASAPKGPRPQTPDGLDFAGLSQGVGRGGVGFAALVMKLAGTGWIVSA